MQTTFVSDEKRIDIVADVELSVKDVARRLFQDLGNYGLVASWYEFLGRFFLGDAKRLTIWYRNLEQYRAQFHDLTFSPNSHVEIRLPAVKDLESGFITVVTHASGQIDVYYESVEEARLRIEALSQTSNPSNSHN